MATRSPTTLPSSPTIIHLPDAEEGTRASGSKGWAKLRKSTSRSRQKETPPNLADVAKTLLQQLKDQKSYSSPPLSPKKASSLKPQEDMSAAQIQELLEALQEIRENQTIDPVLNPSRKKLSAELSKLQTKMETSISEIETKLKELRIKLSSITKEKQEKPLRKEYQKLVDDYYTQLSHLTDINKQVEAKEDEFWNEARNALKKDRRTKGFFDKKGRLATSVSDKIESISEEQIASFKKAYASKVNELVFPISRLGTRLKCSFTPSPEWMAKNTPPSGCNRALRATLNTLCAAPKVLATTSKVLATAAPVTAGLQYLNLIPPTALGQSLANKVSTVCAPLFLIPQAARHLWNGQLKLLTLDLFIGSCVAAMTHGKEIADYAAENPARALGATAAVAGLFATRALLSCCGSRKAQPPAHPATAPSQKNLLKQVSPQFPNPPQPAQPAPKPTDPSATNLKAAVTKEETKTSLKQETATSPASSVEAVPAAAAPAATPAPAAPIILPAAPLDTAAQLPVTDSTDEKKAKTPSDKEHVNPTVVSSTEALPAATASAAPTAPPVIILDTPAQLPVMDPTDKKEAKVPLDKEAAQPPVSSTENLVAAPAVVSKEAEKAVKAKESACSSVSCVSSCVSRVFRTVIGTENPIHVPGKTTLRAAGWAVAAFAVGASPFGWAAATFSAMSAYRYLKTPAKMSA